MGERQGVFADQTSVEQKTFGGREFESRFLCQNIFVFLSLLDIPGVFIFYIGLAYVKVGCVVMCSWWVYYFYRIF